MRHPHAPQVLDLEEGVLVMAHVDAEMLTRRPPVFDPGREGSWLQLAVSAASPAHPGDEDVRDRYRRAYLNVVDRHCARPWRRDLAGQWLQWVDSEDPTSWMSVPLDVILKNTLVDRTGRWWAIDPMCNLAPPAVAWCPWMVDRATRSSWDLPTALAAQAALSVSSPDPATTLRWMPGALLWSLWWAHPGHMKHQMVLDMTDHWLTHWALQHT